MVWYLAIGAGALRSYVIPNKRTIVTATSLHVGEGREKGDVYVVWAGNTVIDRENRCRILLNIY